MRLKKYFPLPPGKPISLSDLGSLNSWYPADITEDKGVPRIAWCHAEHHRFTEPFFYDSVHAMMKEDPQVCYTPIESLDTFDRADCLQPTAFIFHPSRSGSTLVTQLLAQLDECITLSEPAAIDSVLNHIPCSPEMKRARFKNALRIFGQRRHSNERFLFIKFDSWHINHLSFIRSVYPDTPCYFVYRSPAEILSSHRRHRGIQMVPRMLSKEILGLESEWDQPGDLDGYCIEVLSSFFRSALSQANSVDLRLIHLEELPDLIWSEFSRQLSINPSPHQVEKMKARSLKHSKTSRNTFVEADPVYQPSGKHLEQFEKLMALYDQLEDLRRRQKVSLVET